MSSPERHRGFVFWIRKLHIYCGLQTSLFLVLFGVAGLWATARSEGGATRVLRADRFVLPDVPNERVDALVARAATQAAVPLTHAPPRWAVKDSGGVLLVPLYSVNGGAVLEIDSATRTVTVRRARTGWAEFATRMHTETFFWPQPGRHPLLMAWSVYVELSVFALGFLAASSIALWTLDRPRSLAAGTGALVGFGIATLVYLLLR